MLIKLVTFIHQAYTSDEWKACQNNTEAFNQIIATVPNGIDYMSTESYDGIPDCITYESALNHPITSGWVSNANSLPLTMILTSDNGSSWKGVKLTDSKVETMVRAVTTTIQNDGIPSGFLGNSWDGYGGAEGLGYSLCDFLPEWICNIKVPAWIWLIAAGASGVGFVSSDPKNKLAKVVYGGITAGCVFKYATTKKNEAV